MTLALGYALATPRWNNPDEPAHYNYIAHLAQTGSFPELRLGDWDSQRLADRLASGRFLVEGPVDELRYEGHQPPLYYLIMAPVYRLVDGLGANGRIVSLRAVSIVFGALVIAAVFAAARTLTPERFALAPLAAGIVAFVPMHTAMTATINNDTLAELMASATLLAVLVGLRDSFGIRGALAIGALGGCLLLTKLTVYVFVPLALVALAREASSPVQPGGTYRWNRAARQVALASGVMIVIAGWWFVRNLSVYGAPDLFGLQRHDQVVVGQPRWPGPGLEPVVFLAYSLFRSFWGQFGWMAAVLDPRLYVLFFSLVLLSVGGLVRMWRYELPSWAASARLGLLFLLAGLVLVAAQVVIYNLTFIQAQGRYLYPAILPIGILLALGWLKLTEIEPGGSPWHGLGFGLGFYWLWAAAIEAVSWLLTQAPAPLYLHLITVATAFLAATAQLHRPRASMANRAALALVGALFLIDSAALLRFIAPYFKGW